MAVANLVLRRKPQEVGGHVAVLVGFDKVGDDGSPDLVGTVRLEQHTVAHLTLELAVAGADYVVGAFAARATRVAWDRAVYPFPLITQFVIFGGLQRSRAAGHVAKTAGPLGRGRQFNK